MFCDRDIQYRVLQELKGLRDSELPQPKADWDLIWVLSGPQGLEEDSNGMVQEGMGDIRVSLGGRPNQTKNRFNTGVLIARKVTAERLGKNISDLTLDDIRKYGPEIYYNGQDWHNDELRSIFSDQEAEERYGFPGKNIITAPPESKIKHTGDQFKKFSAEIAEKSRVIVVVSDLYHLPRVVRYARLKDSLIPFQKLVFYPSEPFYFPFAAVRAEIAKIPIYISQGDLPKE